MLAILKLMVICKISFNASYNRGRRPLLLVVVKLILLVANCVVNHPT